MPWQNQGGGGPWGGGGPGPWGRGPGGGGPSQPPNIEEMLRRTQERMRRVVPGGMGSLRGVAILAIVAVAIWLASGFYRVLPDQEGVVLTFGKWTATTTPGLNWHWPTPIQSAYTPSVTRNNRVEIGYRTGADQRTASPRDLQSEATMLTGDENIVNIEFTVFWRVKDVGQYLFQVRDPGGLVKIVAESAMREVVGKGPIQQAFTEGRGRIETATQDVMQQLLDSYGAGVEVRQVQLQSVDPPQPVVDAFNDVQRALADRERARNEAEAYSNDILPRARGDAQRLLQEAEGYKQEVTNRAQGDAKRFLSVYEAYRASKDVTTQRLYLETIEQVLKNTKKVIVDRASSSSGVVPYLPLPGLQSGPAAPRPAAPAQPAPAPAQGAR
jgi:modulator of FtsH protease HflK